MSGEVIAWRRADGGVSVLHVAPGARLCRAALVAGEVVMLEPPVPIDRLQAALGEGVVVDYAESEAELLARVRRADLPPEAAGAVTLPAEALPRERWLRDAWRLEAGVVVVDMAAAREALRARIRAARVPALAALDIDYTRADGQGNAAARAAAEAARQRLRDAPASPLIDAATTPADLLAAWPPDLPPLPT